VPVIEFPPTTPLMLQFTALELVPVTVAVNCCVWPRGTEAVAGCTLTVTFGGGFGEEEPVRPQPEANAMVIAAAMKRNEARKCARLRRGYFGDAHARNNLLLSSSRCAGFL